MTIARTSKVSRLTTYRTRDDAADHGSSFDVLNVLTIRYNSSMEWFLMRSDLQHWISRGVNDQILGLHWCSPKSSMTAVPEYGALQTIYVQRMLRSVATPSGNPSVRGKVFDVQAHDLPVPRHRIFPNGNFFQFGCIPIMVATAFTPSKGRIVPLA